MGKMAGGRGIVRSSIPNYLEFCVGAEVLNIFALIFFPTAEVCLNIKGFIIPRKSLNKNPPPFCDRSP